MVLKCHAIYCLSKENIYQNYAISNILIDNGRVHLGIFIPVGNFNLLDFFQLNEEIVKSIHKTDILHRIVIDKPVYQYMILHVVHMHMYILLMAKGLKNFILKGITKTIVTQT